jgi:NADH-quinone oxidoreductase subunit A
MLFIIFDVEVIFFYPWAVIFRELRLFGLAEMAIFVAFLLAAYFYVWRGGGLEWEEEEHVSLREALSRQLIERARERERVSA